MSDLNAIASIQNQITSGKYYAQENVLVLNVEKRILDPQTQKERIEKKEICFEVVNLQYKNGPSSKKVDVLGARTEATMAPIMQSLIHNFTQMKNPEKVFADAFANPVDLQSRDISPEQVKTISFLNYVQPRGQAQPSVKIITSDQQVSGDERSSNDLPFLGNQNEISFKELKDPRSVWGVLNSPAWSVLLKASSNPAIHQHSWIFTSQAAEDAEGAIEATTQALLLPSEENSQVTLFDQLPKQAKLLKQQISSLNRDIENASRLKVYLDDWQNEILNSLNEEDQSANEILAYQILKPKRIQVNDLLKELNEVQKSLKHSMERIKAIYRFVKSRNFKAQLQAPGEASFSDLLSMDWYQLLLDHKLLNDSNLDTAEFLQERLFAYPKKELQDLKDKALNSVFEIHEEFALEEELELNGYQDWIEGLSAESSVYATATSSLRASPESVYTTPLPLVEE